MGVVQFCKHCILLVVLAAYATVAIASAANLAEYSVKAAYLSKFGTFVQWPPDTFTDPMSPLNLCIIGVDPFGNVLDEVVDGLHVDSHPIKVKRLPSINRPTDCQIVFVDGNDSHEASKVVDALRGTRVLTVTDTGNDTAGAGIINFLIKDNRVRFGVDHEAAEKNGLTISSRLLVLAVYVRGKKE